MKRLILGISLGLTPTCLPLVGQASWFFSPSVQFLDEVSLTTPDVQAYHLTLGARYVSERLSVYGSMPLVWVNDPSQTQSTSSMMSGSSLIPSLGDFFLSGRVEVISEGEVIPALSPYAQVKVPIATGGVGSGAFDFGGGLGVRKELIGLMWFADVGKLKLGDTDSTDYLDPWTYGVGLGKIFFNGKFSVLVYYSGSGPILSTSASPSQVSVGLNVLLSQDYILTMYGLKGLSSGSPDYGALLGLQIGLD